MDSRQMYIALVFLLIYLKLPFASSRNIVIGLLVDLSISQQDNGQDLKVDSYLQADEIAHESSNWIIDGPQDLPKMFQAVKQKFKEYSNQSATTFTFRQIPFSPGASLKTIISLLYENKDVCDAIIFGFFTEARQSANFRRRKLLCDAVDALVTELNIPTFSWACVFQQYSANTSLMLSLLPSAETIGRSVTSTLHHLKWRKIAILTTAWPDEWSFVCDEIEKQIMSSNHFDVQYYKRFPRQNITVHSNTKYFEQTWRELRRAQASAVLICVPQETREETKTSFLDALLISAYEVDEEHARTRAFVVVDWKGTQQEHILNAKQNTNTVLKSRRSVSKTMDSSLSFTNLIIEANFTRKVKTSQDYQDGNQRFSQNFAENMKVPVTITKRSTQNEVYTMNNDVAHSIIYENVLTISPSLPHQSLILEANDVFKYDTFYFMDSLLLAMSAFYETKRIHGNEKLTNGRFLIERASQLHITNGHTGNICYTDSQERTMNFTVWDVIENSGLSMTPVLIINATWSDTTFFEVRPINEIKWSLNGKPATDTCDTMSFLCHVTSNGFQTQDFVVVLFCGTGLYMMIYGAYLFLRKKKEWQVLLRGPNKLFLTDNDLKFLTVSNRPFASDSCREISPHVSGIGSIITLADQNGFNEDVNLALLKGEYVFLKRLCGPAREIRKSTRDCLKQIKDLRNENLCVVHGLYSNKTFTCLVTEYGHRRSLKELIENRDCELNWTFKVSLLHDLVRGMKYLHSSPIHCHGRLKSRNCVVDGRFVLKITDYGVNRLQNSMGVSAEINNDPKDLLWTAPELLNDPTLRLIGTQKGDSYSFSIICQELILREDPFSMVNLPAEEIIEKLKKAPPLIRPSVHADAAPIEIIQIMKQCWQEQPELRLTFSAVHSEIKRMNRGKKHNIVEDMMKQLEDYSSHLEELVNERTVELKEEKKKTEQLLMRMLPPSVAKLLMANQKIVPETFDNCTIYFSDICGFTTIAHASSPMQVVDFLNDLYTCFDAIIERYELYKVETIGDAYMVSSGIPKVIGERHAEEAALMALDIMSATTTFRIRHLPEVDVRIRIGMHSGPAVAGVVGLTMPRYCLFGDTINTASRLETTGIPSRIHISSDTKLFLDNSENEFSLQKRGTIELKGRGKMETWWLLGMKGFTKPLPNPGDINAPNHGIKLDKLSAPSVNQSTNNSKNYCALDLSASEHVDCKPHLMSTRAINNPVSSRRGSSFVIPTPLALIPELVSKTRYKPPKYGDESILVDNAKNQRRSLQAISGNSRTTSVAPMCLYSNYEKL